MTRTTGNILFLGDLAEEVRHLEASLLRGGQNVFSAKAEDAVQAMDEYSPDLVITNLPTLNEEASNLLGRGGEEPFILVVLDPAEAARLGPSLHQAMQLGARDYLAMPFSLEDECAKLSALMEQCKLSVELSGMRHNEGIQGLRNQVGELKERYLQQNRSHTEAQDIFYLDLSRMMTIIDNIRDGIIFTDSEGQITLLNPVADKLLGVKPIVAIGKRLRQLVVESELLEQIQKDQHQAMMDGDTSERVVEIHQNSALLYIQINTTPVHDYKGSFAGILTVLKDVTHEQIAEDNKNQYLSIVSHELRTPLTGIKTFATLLSRGALGELSPNQQGVAQSIREQALRLEHEIDKIICLGRIESGEFAMDLEVFPMVDLLDLAVAPFEQVAREAEVEFRLDMPAFCPLVRADREDLRRALQALIENAIKFTPAGGSVDIDILEDSDSVIVFVRDNGPGIDKRYQGRIFEKFFQVEDPLTRHHGGAGLGLCVARGVATAHGGEILLESDLGKGACFGIRLPKFDMHQLEDAGTLAI
jgi:two-component system, OmpR family, sensor histidine kinase VicK